MTGRGPYNPFGRGETPEERVDRLISEVLSSPNNTKCAELRSALGLLPSNDHSRRARAFSALDGCP